MDNELVPINALAANALASCTAAGSLSTRFNMAVPSLLSACIFSKQLEELEMKHAEDSFGEFWGGIFANATACVLLTVGAVESYINEIFTDYQQNFPGHPVDELKQLWEENERERTIDKYKLALKLRGTAKLNLGNRTGQSISALIAFRNALMHFKPEWFEKQDAHKELSERLSQFISPSPFVPDEPLFPRAWASHGCTAWAIKSAIGFIDEFDQQAGWPMRLEKFRSQLVY